MILGGIADHVFQLAAETDPVERTLRAVVERRLLPIGGCQHRFLNSFAVADEDELTRRAVTFIFEGESRSRRRENCRAGFMLEAGQNVALHIDVAIWPTLEGMLQTEGATVGGGGCISRIKAPGKLTQIFYA